MYQLGKLFTIMTFIISIFIIIMSISNIVAYGNIIAHPDDINFNTNWAKFLLGLSIFGVIIGFVLFFWIIYIWVKGKRTIGETKFAQKISTFGPSGVGVVVDPNAHRTQTTIEDLKQSYREDFNRDLSSDYPDIKYRCSDGDNRLMCPSRAYGGDNNDYMINTLANQYVSNNLPPPRIY